MEDVLLPGDVVGEGRDFAGSELRALGGQGPSDVAPELEVIRKLGSGSYAVVYLVREVLSRVGGPGSSDDHATGRMDDYDAPSNRSSEEVVYGREFALKCLSKMNLVDDEALAAQMTEVGHLCDFTYMSI
jgi:serine/threonine protein kinase